MSNMPHRRVIDKSVKVDYIAPSEPLGNTLSFTPEKTSYNLKLGYFDALRYTDSLAGKKFYVKNEDDEAFYGYMESVGVPFYKKLTEILNVRGNKRKLIAAAAEKLAGGAENLSAFAAFENFLEPFAEAYGLERFRVYEPYGFIDSLSTQYRKTGRVNVERSKDINPVSMEIFNIFFENL